MSPEDVQSEIKLIFARACAEGLKNETRLILEMDDYDQKKGAAENFGIAFSSAFLFVCERFTEGLISGGSMPSPSSHIARSSSTPVAAPQSDEVKSCPVPDDSLGSKPTSLEVGR